jgi:hypothetical protein
MPGMRSGGPSAFASARFSQGPGPNGAVWQLFPVFSRCGLIGLGRALPIALGLGKTLRIGIGTGPFGPRVLSSWFTPALVVAGFYRDRADAHEWAALQEVF